MAAATWTAGQWSRSQRLLLAASAEKASRAETGRAQAHELGVLTERTRLARELHDIVSHSLAVIVAQADGARFVMHTSPDEARDALRAISATGRSATRDMAGLLGVLRPAASTDLTPLPRLDDLLTLVSDVRSTGMKIEYVVSGQSVDLSPGAQLVVFRVAQEGLTNVLRHAGTTAQVLCTLRWTAETLVVTIKNEPGQGGPGEGSGLGLVGLQERLEQYGGTMTAGVTADGGFRLEAVMPVGTSERPRP